MQRSSTGGLPRTLLCSRGPESKPAEGTGGRRLRRIGWCTAAAVSSVAALFFLAAPAKGQQLDRIRFIPESAGSSIKIEARYPRVPGVCEARQPGKLHAAYKGVIEVGRRPDGRLYLVTELPFSDYLKGIAEVPRNWPPEALKAQVVAARTYAIKHFDPSNPVARELNINLCSTDACQVFRGLLVERGAWGEQWVKAVEETSGEILEHRGKPADAVYFSTSNGRTLSNADVFKSAPLPYLVSVAEEDDGQSPLSNWSVKMPLTDLSETLMMAGAIGGPVKTIRQKGDSIKLSAGGPTRSMSLVEFRNAINAHAVCLVPKRYPTAGSDGRPLPQVIPSKWISVRQEGREIVIDGRGWGHGAGMVQWGAKGKAERGTNYRDILAYYYGGLSPVTRPEPDLIRVSLALGIDHLILERRGDFRIEGPPVPEGPVEIQGGPSIRISSGEPIFPALRLENVAVSHPARGQLVRMTFELSNPARVAPVVKGAGGNEIRLPAEPKDRGPQALWVDPSQAALPPGPLSVALTADDGVDTVTSAPLQLEIAADRPGASPSPSPSPKPAAKASAPSRQSLAPVLAAAAVLLVASTAFAGLLLLRRRRNS